MKESGSVGDEPHVPRNDRLSNEEIRRRAYELYLERNGENGDDLNDWLRAENEYRQAHPDRFAESTNVPVADHAEPLEQHEPRYTKSGGMVSPKFGSAGSGGAEYERLPEAHDDRDAG